jgi:hypothetical protein
METSYVLDGRCSIPSMAGNYSPYPDRLLGPPSFLSGGYQGEGVKRPAREADNS